MISKKEFIDQFTILEYAHGMIPDKKRAEVWFKEVEKVDKRIFSRAMAELKYHKDAKTGKTVWPSFEVFWAYYRKTEKTGRSGKPNRKEKGCKLCVGGYIHHIETNYKTDQKTEVVSWCKDCYPDHPYAVNPRGAFNYIPTCSPFERNERKAESHG